MERSDTYTKLVMLTAGTQIAKAAVVVCGNVAAPRSVKAVASVLGSDGFTAATVRGITGFSALRGKRVSNSAVVIREVGDLHPFSEGPVFDASTVVIESCDKNFVYYWVDRRHFPGARLLVLQSHPCEPGFFWRWSDAKDTTILLAPVYGNYKTRWAPEQDNVVVDDFTLSFAPEELRCESQNPERHIKVATANVVSRLAPVPDSRHLT